MLTSLFLSGLSIFLFASLMTLPFILRPARWLRQAALWLVIIASSLFLTFSAYVFLSGQLFSFKLYEILPSLELSFIVDRLAAFFMMIISLVSACTALYSLSYVEHSGSGERKSLAVSLMSLFILAMLLVVASDNTFSFIFFWEIMSSTSFFMVLFDYEKKESQKSGLFYFVMTQMSTLFLLFGFLAIRSQTGSFAILSVNNINPALTATIFLALFIGFGIKAGVMPFHKWLPYAHSASPSNISALMSGVMIKVAIYGLLRFILFVLPTQSWWGVLVLLFGTLSAVMGVIYALKEHDIKRLLAYHSIENIGIILMGIGLYLIFLDYGLAALAELSLLGALFHTLNHALFKSLLFMTAGSVINATGTRNIEGMGGLIKLMPYTGTLFLIGAVAISALPPLNGFASELMLFQAFLQSFLVPSPLVRVLLFVGLSLFGLTSALAAACFVKAFGIIFLAAPRSSEASHAREVSPYMLIGPGVLGLMCILLGVFSFQIFSALGFAVPIPDIAVVGLLLIFFLLLTWVVLRFTTTGKTRVSETWGCGLVSQNSRMEYTASGFFDPLLTVFKIIYRPEKTTVKNYYDSQSSIFKDGSVEIHTLKLFEKHFYMPVVRAIERLSRFISKSQDVDLDTYILYSFAAVIVLLLAMGWII